MHTWENKGHKHDNFHNSYVPKFVLDKALSSIGSNSIYSFHFNNSLSPLLNASWTINLSHPIVDQFDKSYEAIKENN